MARHKDNKKMLLQALEQSLGIVTPACKAVGVSRETYYLYMRNDPEFREAVEQINEITLDFVENQLFKKIKDGSERSILFYMKYKARKRGYTDSIDITSGGEKIIDISKLVGFENKKKDAGEDN